MQNTLKKVNRWRFILKTTTGVYAISIKQCYRVL